MKKNDHLLKTSIDKLYKVFAKYPMQLEEHYFKKASEYGYDFSKQLKELSPDDLCLYASSAMTTWGGVDDFKHFLPRLFELLVYDDLGVDRSIIVGKLNYGNWKQWSEREQKAVDEYLNVWWECTLASYPAQYSDDVDDCLCSIACAVDDLTTYLKYWQESSFCASMRHLANFTEQNFLDLYRRSKLNNAFWPNAQSQQVVKWLLNSEIQEILEKAFFEIDEKLIANEIETAFNQLEWLKKAHEFKFQK